MAFCTLCRIVWTISNTGTCRACRPEYWRKAKARRLANELADVQAVERQEAFRTQPARIPTIHRSRRVVRVDGVAFEVVWDGSMRPPEVIQ